MDSHVAIALGLTTAAGLSTLLGGSLVLFSQRNNPRLLAFGLAFAAGAMVYVSLAEILPKATAAFSLDVGPRAGLALGTSAFIGGLLLILALDHLVPNPHDRLDDGHGHPAQADGNLARIGLLSALAITAHNLPEGLATFFATLDNPAVGAPLALAIAIHNIPEGIAVAIPVFAATGSRRAALLASLVAGLAEPLGALLGYALLGPDLSPGSYGTVFGLIAGIMVFLALDELLPAAKHHGRGHETVYGLVGGMALMAISLVLLQW